MKSPVQDTFNPKKQIFIKNAHLNNLKNIDLLLPKNALIVITGVSGSGKSSLAFDTLYAEGQRRYVESLSSYARQFLGKLEKPKVDDIKGLAPSIAIQQKVITSNPRSTVGTTTEVYEYVKLLFARLGKTFSPISGEEVKKDSVSDVIDYIKSFPPGTELTLKAKRNWEAAEFATILNGLKLSGFTRLEVDGNLAQIQDLEDFKFVPNEGASIYLVIDHFETDEDEENFQRLADSIQIAFYEGNGRCVISCSKTNTSREFSNKFEKDGIEFFEPSPYFFSFNNPIGACPTCEGFGMVIGIDEDLVIPNKKWSVYEDCVACWRGESMSKWKKEFIRKVPDFPIHKPYFELNKAEKDLLWKGPEGKSDPNFPSITNFFSMLGSNLGKMQNRIMLARFRGKTKCHTCDGLRLKEETSYVKINEYCIQDFIVLPLDELSEVMNSLNFSEYEEKIASRLLFEIRSRLDFLVKVGLGYLDLNRTSRTLSGGESQRINLATSLGSSLVGSIYVLDEPSIGLHSRDTQNLISVLHNLRNLGNTVIVVEHDEDVMRAADYIVDIGPEAGNLGGRLMFAGPYDELAHSGTLTADYLTLKKKIFIPKKRRKPTGYIKIRGARVHNLANVDVDFPTGLLCAVSGLSGSGKSSLLKEVLYPGILLGLGQGGKKADVDSVDFELKNIQAVEMIDQNPIGKSSRSNPVTYLKAYDDIRTLFSNQKTAKALHLKPKHFSFNVDGGRCDECKGEGVVLVSMQFMADIELKCEVCNGKRFKDEILEVKIDSKNISDILEMTVDDSIQFFTEMNENKISQKLKPLQEVGLGYLQLGQSSSTLSGGEAQRVKLASYLVKGNSHEKTLFIFDEPSTGLHFHDIEKLLVSFRALLELGHSVIVIEHQPDILAASDWIIDVGPGAGKYGGTIVFSGTPEDLSQCENSSTAPFIKEKLEK